MKISLHIYNFTCYDNYTLELERGISLVKGRSGSGKSSALNAIMHCLYGKMTNVARDIHEKAYISMTFDEGNVKNIVRRGQKDLTLVEGDETHRNDKAQERVNKIFGTYEEFKLACYLPAESRHPLVGGSLSECRDMASYIFPDLETYDKMKSSCSSMGKSLQKEMDDLEKRKSNISGKMEGILHNNEWIRDCHEPPDVDRKSLLRELEDLRKKRRKLSSALNEIPNSPPDEEELKRIEDKLVGIRISEKSKQDRVEYIQGEIHKLESRIHTLTPHDKDLESMCQEYRSLRVGDVDSLDEEIERKRSKLSECESRLNYAKIKDQLDNPLQCPSCELNLIYSDGKLTKIIDYPDEYEQEYDISNLERIYSSLKTEILNMENKRELWRNNISRKNEIEQYLGRGAEIDADSIIREMQEYRVISGQLNDLKGQLENIKNDTSTYISEGEYNELVRRRDEIISQKQSMDKHQRTVHDICGDADPTTYLLGIDTRISNIENDPRDKGTWDTYMRYSEELSSLDVRISEKHEKVKKIRRIEAILDEAFEEYVNGMLSTLRKKVSSYLKEIFDETMNIYIKSYIESKNGMRKPSISISVDYQGVRYHKISQMSTGERRRLSIAFILSLNEIFGRKFLLLDEALKSMEEETCAMVMNILNDSGERDPRFILVTEHYEPPGGYNQVFDLDDVRRSE